MDIKVDEYINKQKSPQKEVCVYLRSLIHKTEKPLYCHILMVWCRQIL